MKPLHAKALDILKSRDREPTDVQLRGGKMCLVYNVAWGYDLGEDIAHITTNISPSPEETHAVDFFYSDDIVQISDPESGGVFFSADNADVD